MTTPDPAAYLAICETKARYCRCLDQKDWAGYADVFAPNAVLDTTNAGGPLITGREALVAMVRGSVGDAVTVHQVHAPELRLTGDGTVEAVFAMQDRVIWAPEKAREVGRKSLTGYGHYSEQYQRCDDGEWRITRSALTRLHVDFEPL